MIRLLLTVCFINILFSLFLFIKPSEIKEYLIFEIKRGDSYPRIVDKLENIDNDIKNAVDYIIPESFMNSPVATKASKLIKLSNNSKIEVIRN